MCKSVSVCEPVPVSVGVRGGQKKALEPLELELQGVYYLWGWSIDEWSQSLEGPGFDPQNNTKQK